MNVLTRPSLSVDEAEAALRTGWGIEGVMSSLPSERDQNFLVEGEGGRYVLKIANRTEDPAVLDMQNRAMARLVAEGLPCPRLIRARGGEDVTVHGDHLVRLFGYLDGRPLAQVHPRPAGLLRDLGRTMGSVDAALVGFEHGAASRHLYWDVKHVERTMGDRLAYIGDPDGRDLVRRTLERFLAATGPALEGLRISVIHNDANDHNVLVDRDAERVTGLLDFGDMVRTYVANEVAVACTYAMLDEEDALQSATAVVEGYRETAPLEDAELSVLLDLIRIRLATSVSVAAHQHAQRPDDPYLTVSQAQAWALLERLDLLTADQARALFVAAT